MTSSLTSPPPINWLPYLLPHAAFRQKGTPLPETPSPPPSPSMVGIIYAKFESNLDLRYMFIVDKDTSWLYLWSHISLTFDILVAYISLTFDILVAYNPMNYIIVPCDIINKQIKDWIAVKLFNHTIPK